MNAKTSDAYLNAEKLMSRWSKSADSSITLEIGVDLVHIPTFARMLKESPKLIDKIFLNSEQPFAMNSIAANFAAKEAVIKACSQININLTCLDIQIRREINGAPYVYSENSLLNTVKLKISLSHHDQFAIAFAVAWK